MLCTSIRVHSEQRRCAFATEIPYFAIQGYHINRCFYMYSTFSHIFAYVSWLHITPNKKTQITLFSSMRNVFTSHQIANLLEKNYMLVLFAPMLEQKPSESGRVLEPISWPSVGHVKFHATHWRSSWVIKADNLMWKISIGEFAFRFSQSWSQQKLMQQPYLFVTCCCGEFKIAYCPLPLILCFEPFQSLLAL